MQIPKSKGIQAIYKMLQHSIYLCTSSCVLYVSPDGLQYLKQYACYINICYCLGNKDKRRGLHTFRKNAILKSVFSERLFEPEGVDPRWTRSLSTSIVQTPQHG